MGRGRETIVTVLPDGHDPASWLRERGAGGLCAFTRKGCLDLPTDAVKPRPAGGLLANRILAQQIAIIRQRDPYAETALAIPATVRMLAAEATRVPGEPAARRFATSAGTALAQLADGMNAEQRSHQILAEIRSSAQRHRHATGVSDARSTAREPAQTGAAK